MISDVFFEKLLEIEPDYTRQHFCLAPLTTFKIGGTCDAFVTLNSINTLSKVIKLCKSENVPFTLIGAGSNLLVSDKGIAGVVARLGTDFDTVTVGGNKLTAGAYVSLAKLARAAQRASLSGLEFASGIPGTLGGAIFMNAGAYDGEMKNVVVKTNYLDENGDMHSVTGDEHDFSYRHSFFSSGKKYIVSAELELVHKDADVVMATMRELNARRKEKQPLDKPSAGSTFKRPEGFYAAKLIEDAGLKGARVGDAEVSKKHSGFIVNNGSATAKDVLELIKKVQDTVFEKFGVKLEPEIKITGRE